MSRGIFGPVQEGLKWRSRTVDEVIESLKKSQLVIRTKIWRMR